MRHKASGPQPAATGTARRTIDNSQDTRGRDELQRADGADRKLATHRMFEVRRELYILRGRRALLRRLLDNDTATADHVRDAIELPRGIDPVCLGAVPGALARGGIIERAGYAPSSRADAHHRPVSVWRLADRDGALAWLEAHPDRPEPAPLVDAFVTLFDMGAVR